MKPTWFALHTSEVIGARSPFYRFNIRFIIRSEYVRLCVFATACMLTTRHNKTNALEINVIERESKKESTGANGAKQIYTCMLFACF